MILDFKMKNFKSFYNETDISMMADNTKSEYKDRLINVISRGNVKKNILPSMVIYGANASGKTSIIKAINMLRAIVINGTIKREINNKVIDQLEISTYIHNISNMEEPIEFSITFKTDIYIYKYTVAVKVDFPMFGNTRKIVKEELNILEYQKIGTSIKENFINLFNRDENTVNINNSKDILKIYDKNEEYSKELINIERNSNENLDKESLFLINGFKGSISLKIANNILEWFQNKLITIVDFSTMEPLINFENSNEENVVYRNKILDKLIKKADFGPQNIGFMKQPNTNKYILASMYEPKGGKGGIIINSKDIESKGTTKLIDFWVGFLEKFSKGGIFIIDEFDCSIHPELVGGIIDLFNNLNINKFNSQLIFNTHNPLYLQKRFFRRDQIMFVDKDEDTYMSYIYKLSDFDVRNDNNYMKKYFEGEFGALPFIDFESVLSTDKDGDK